MNAKRDKTSKQEAATAAAEEKIFLNGERRQESHGPIVVTDESSVLVDFSNTEYSPTGMGNQHIAAGLKIAEVEIRLADGQTILYGLPSNGRCKATINCRAAGLTKSVVIQGRAPVDINFDSEFAVLTSTGARRQFRHPTAKIDELFIEDTSGTELLRLNLRHLKARLIIWDDHA
jgi:hypothetical protein